MRSRGTLAALAVVGASLVTACGSTVHLTSATLGAQGGTVDQGLGAVPGAATQPATSTDPASTPTDGAAPAPAVTVPGTSGTPAAPALPTTATKSSSAVSSAATTAAGKATKAAASTTTAARKPTTTAPVPVGFLVLKDTGAAFSALGYNGLSSGDGQRQATTAATLVSTLGGIAGRKITPVIYQLDATQDLQTQSQSACSTFFDDTKVQAVITSNVDDVVEACAAQHGVPYVQASPQTLAAADLAAHPGVVLAANLTYENAATALVKGLVAQGWFRPASPTEKVTVGLLTQEGTGTAGVKAVVDQQLKAAGLSLADTFLMPATGSSPGAAASQGQSAALKFASDGINRVVVVDAGGFAVSWFAIDSDTQGYHPRLGLTSLSLPQSETLVVSPASLAGASGIGWLPVVDTLDAQQPTLTPRSTQCDQAMKAAGETVSDLAKVEQHALCEGTFLLADAWKAGTTTLPAFQQGLAALGTGHASILTFATSFAASRAGATQYRDLAYHADCDCFQYGSQTYTAG